jgi:8-oxo-dGTP diphosphatase
LAVSGAEDDGVVRAAGGVVVRDGPAGPEVLVVHRPRYDDWSFPKGKRDPGETDEETALREVLEETGLACSLVAPLGEVRYRDAHGRLKVVRYWRMAPDPAGEGHFVPTAEVDALRWCGLAEAGRLLTYAHDRALLGHVEAPGEAQGGGTIA